VGVLVAFNLTVTIIEVVQDKCKQKVFKKILAEKMKARELETINKKYIIQPEELAPEEFAP
jgi:hypothetical protein